METSRFLVAGFYKRTCGVRVSTYQTLKDCYSKTGTAHDILHEHLWQRYDANVLSSYQALKDLENHGEIYDSKKQEASLETNMCKHIVKENKKRR